MLFLQKESSRQNSRIAADREAADCPDATTRTIGEMHVPTWLGILILLSLVAILPIVTILRWLTRG